CLKIDQSFVTRMLDDAKDVALAQSVIELGHRLDLRVIAEGVETEAVWDYLRELGCDEAQGYFLARPLPVEDVESWLAAHAASVVPMIPAMRQGEVATTV